MVKKKKGKGAGLCQRVLHVKRIRGGGGGGNLSLIKIFTRKGKSPENRATDRKVEPGGGKIKRDTGTDFGLGGQPF